MDKSKNNRKNYGTAYFATAFLAAFFFEFYWIMTDPYNHFMLFGTGIIMIIMGYLTIDSLLKTKADNDAIKNEQNEMMLKAQKAIYIATKKSSKEVAKVQVQNIKAMELLMNQMISSQQALLEEKNSNGDDINALIDQLQESNTKLAKEVQSAITVNQLVKANADLVKNVRDALSANSMTYEQTTDLGAYVSAAVGNPAPVATPQTHVATPVQTIDFAAALNEATTQTTEPNSDVNEVPTQTMEFTSNTTNETLTNLNNDININELFSDDFMDKAVAETAVNLSSNENIDLDALLSDESVISNENISFVDNTNENVSLEETSSVDVLDDDTSLEDTSSVDVIDDDTSLEDTSSVDVLDDDTSLEDTSSVDFIDDDTSLEDTSSVDVIDDDTSLEEASTVDILNDNTSLEEVSTIDVLSDNVSFEDSSPENILSTEFSLSGIDDDLFTDNTFADIVPDVSINFTDDTMSAIENEINLDEMERSEALEEITIPDEMTEELDEAMTEGNPEAIMNEVVIDDSEVNDTDYDTDIDIETDINTDAATSSKVTTLPPDLASGNIPNRQLSDEEIAALFASL